MLELTGIWKMSLEAMSVYFPQSSVHRCLSTAHEYRRPKGAGGGLGANILSILAFIDS